RLVHDGKPVSFAAGRDIELRLFHETGQSFGIPIKEDGTFQIGWMPIGKYSATLDRPSRGKGGPSRYSVPGGLAIEDGKAEYTIELGKNWKPCRRAGHLPQAREDPPGPVPFPCLPSRKCQRREGFKPPSLTLPARQETRPYRPGLRPRRGVGKNLRSV